MEWLGRMEQRLEHQDEMLQAMRMHWLPAILQAAPGHAALPAVSQGISTAGKTAIVLSEAEQRGTATSQAFMQTVPGSGPGQLFCFLFLSVRLNVSRGSRSSTATCARSYSCFRLHASLQILPYVIADMFGQYAQHICIYIQELTANYMVRQSCLAGRSCKNCRGDA